jgi:predicted AlkP superfamily pyrophosphatase or phosphodiesterase
MFSKNGFGEDGTRSVIMNKRVYMSKKTVFGIVCLFPLIAGPAYSQSVDTVLVVSIDALHPDALTKGITPVIGDLMKQGTYTLKGRSTDPPKTLIAHTAMFTGLEPAASGKIDNGWKPGEPQVQKPTIFDTAKRLGYRTAFFYSKTKLGYLANGAVDEHALAPDDGVDRARQFIGKQRRSFVFLHVSGLEYEGSEYGWLSPEYLAELSSIDRALVPLLEDIRKRGQYLIILTSDHAGHGKLHGTDHPEDYRLPLIVVSDIVACREIRDRPYPVTELKTLVEQAISSGSCSGRMQ